MEGKRLLLPLVLASASALVAVSVLLAAPAVDQTELEYSPPWSPGTPNKNKFVHVYAKSVGLQQELAETQLHFTPPWEQTPPHYNRYRFSHEPPGRQQQLAMKHAALRPGQHAHKVLSKAHHHRRTGKQIYSRLLGALAKEISHKKRGATKQNLASSDGNLADDPNAVEMDDDAPASTVYIYRGREIKPKYDEMITFILAGGFGVEDIKYIEDSSDAEVRKALWDPECQAVIMPPLHDIPDFGPNAVKDIRHYVGRGMTNKGTMLFLGSSVEVHIINKLFGFEMQQDFKPGPYYKSERHTQGTALELLPARVNELGNTESLGILKTSLPPESRSFYDSFGDSVASCVRYDLGRVCYLAQDFQPLLEMPHLQVELEDDDEYVAEEAERRLEALGRKTDTWLAIFQGMLENPQYEKDGEVGNWDGW